MSKEKPQQFLLPTWAQKAGLTGESLLQITQTGSLPLVDERDQRIFDGTLEFSNRYNVDFSLCCSHALDLFLKEGVTKEDVVQYLSEKLEIFKESRRKKLPKKCKTILLLGDTGQGKSLFTSHLIGREEAKVGESSESTTRDSQLYFSERCNLNIIDTEGFNGTSQTMSNDELLAMILLQIVYFLEFGVSIDAFILMWCPLKNGKSGISRTLDLIEKTFGKKALDSCIVMIQGNWRPLAEILNLTQAVPSEVESLKKKYHRMPVIEYDAKGSFEEQFGGLKKSIEEVEPYRKEFFDELRKEQFFNMVKVFKFKIQEEFERTLPGDRKEEIMKLFKDFQSSMLASIIKKEEEMKEKRSFWKNLFTMENIKKIFTIDNITFVVGLGQKIIKAFMLRSS